MFGFAEFGATSNPAVSIHGNHEKISVRSSSVPFFSWRSGWVQGIREAQAEIPVSGEGRRLRRPYRNVKTGGAIHRQGTASC
jgi:hypothetical protein